MGNRADRQAAWHRPFQHHAAKKRPPSARAIRDAELKPVIQRVYDENFVAYGGDKMWDHLNNVDGIRVARCAVERLMRDMGLSGVQPWPILGEDNHCR